MKQLLLFSLLLFFALIPEMVVAQQITTPTIQKITEVYGPSFPNDNPGMYQKMEDLLNNRIRYTQVAQEPNEKYTKLSSRGLLNKNNPSMTRDQTFNEGTFNPLKYDLNFYAKTTQIYRIDNSNYLIVIDPM